MFLYFGGATICNMSTFKAKTVNFDYLYENKGLKEHVYLPSSDTFTFVEALEEEIDTFSDDAHTILEMGAGSGYLTLCLDQMFHKKRMSDHYTKKKPMPLFYCADINTKACECIKKLSHINKINNIEVINTNLFKGISKCKQFDIILFNPPYVATDEMEMNKTDITASYAGGKFGREVILKFLKDVNEYLNDNGCIYLLLEKSNVPYQILNHSKIAKMFNYVELKRKKTLNETIFIFKLVKKNPTLKR